MAQTEVMLQRHHTTGRRAEELAVSELGITVQTNDTDAKDQKEAATPSFPSDPSSAALDASLRTRLNHCNQRFESSKWDIFHLSVDATFVWSQLKTVIIKPWTRKEQQR